MKKGFTLIELLISIALLGIILMAVSSIFATSLKNYRVNSQKSFYQKELNFAIDDIAKNIKQAVDTPLSYDTFNSGNQTLILGLPATDASNNFVYNATIIQEDYYVYYLDGTTLKRKVYSQPGSNRYLQNGQDIPLLSDVTGFNVTYATNQVSMNITLSKAVGKATVTVTGARTANLRNGQ